MMRKLTHEEIVRRQIKKSQELRLPLSVVLHDIRSLHNVGAIFRTADGVGVEKLWLCGITGCPPHPQIVKTAIGAEQKVVWEHHPDTLIVIRSLKQKGYQIVLLEQMEESLPFDEFQPDFPVCLVVGNEIEGISQELLGLCDKAVDIEMSGVKNSLNVAVAFGIAAYHMRSCFKKGVFHGFQNA